MGRKPSKHCSKEEIQMTNRHMKRYSTLLTIREMPIQITMKYHFTPVRTPIIKKSTKNRCWRGCGEKGALLHCLWECKLVHSLYKTVWGLLRRLKIKLPYYPAIPLLSIYPDKNIFQKDTYTPMFITALFPIAKIWKEPKCPPTDGWIKETWYIQTTEYCSATKSMK